MRVIFYFLLIFSIKNVYALTPDLNVWGELNNGDREIHISSNLPEGTLLLINLVSPLKYGVDRNVTQREGIINYKGEAEAIFAADLFKDITWGNYILNIVSFKVAKQPKNVRNIFGEDGEKLNGGSVSLSKKEKYIDLSFDIIQKKGGAINFTRNHNFTYQSQINKEQEIFDLIKDEIKPYQILITETSAANKCRFIDDANANAIIFYIIKEMNDFVTARASNYGQVQEIEKSTRKSILQGVNMATDKFCRSNEPELRIKMRKLFNLITVVPY